jgi:hypothetical protein
MVGSSRVTDQPARPVCFPDIEANTQLCLIRAESSTCRERFHLATRLQQALASRGCMRKSKELTRYIENPHSPAADVRAIPEI